MNLAYRWTFGVLALCVACADSSGGSEEATTGATSETSTESTDASSTESGSDASSESEADTTTEDSSEASTDATSEDTTDTSTDSSDTTESTDTDTGVMGCEGGPEISVLFIGNSYTFFNDLPAMVAEVACSAGYVVNHDDATQGGYTFGSHLNDANTQAKIASAAWDVVILQNQSQIPGFPSSQVMSQSVPNAEGLADLIEANDPNTEIMYFQTWGRRDGDQQNCASHPPVCTFEGHTEELAGGYALYQAATGGVIAPIGYAWRDAVADADAPFDTQQLWNGDGSHPSLYGSYLTAVAFFAALYDESSLGLSYPDGITADEAAFMQQMADGAVLMP